MPGSVTVKELFLKSNHQESGTILQGPMIVDTRDKTPISQDKFTTFLGGYSKLKTPAFKIYRAGTGAYSVTAWNDDTGGTYTRQSIIHDIDHAIEAPAMFDQNPTGNTDYGIDVVEGCYICPVTGFWQLNFFAQCVDNALYIPGMIPILQEEGSTNFEYLCYQTATGMTQGCIYCTAVNNNDHDHKQANFSVLAYVKAGQKIKMLSDASQEVWTGGMISGYLVSHEEDSWYA
jgi:hypothetical protein